MEDPGGMSDMREYWRDVKRHQQMEKQENRQMERPKELSPKRKISSNANTHRIKIPKVEVDTSLSPDPDTPVKLDDGRSRSSSLDLDTPTKSDGRGPRECRTIPKIKTDALKIIPLDIDSLRLVSPKTETLEADTPNFNTTHNEALKATDICTDWCVVSGSCHYARDNAWFKTYKPLSALAAGMTIKGIGTVELLVRTNPQDASQTRKIIMKDVLHIPDAICNGFQPAFSGVGSMSYGGVGMVGRDDDDNICFYAEAPASRFGPELIRRVPQLVLAECVPRGVSFLNHGPNVAYMLSIHLSDEEEDMLFPPRRSVTYV